MTNVVKTNHNQIPVPALRKNLICLKEALTMELSEVLGANRPPVCHVTLDRHLPVMKF